MASAAQIKANQKNSRKSTGPKTTRGKAKVSLNAITHGIFSEAPLLSCEKLEDYQLLYDSLFEELSPKGHLEAAIVERIIHAVWRQKRLEKAETAKIELSQLNQQVFAEVNATMMLDIKDWVQIKDFYGEADPKKVELNKAIIEELKSVKLDSGITSIENLRQQAPHVYQKIQLEAKRKNLSLEAFFADKQGVLLFVSSLHKGAEAFIQASSTRQFAKAVSDLVKQTKLMPNPIAIDQLMRYQVQLDNDLYKAINELRKLQEWRIKTIEGELLE